MALNLVRNSRVFFTTNVDPNTGIIYTTGHTSSTTREIQVLDGFTFTQNTTSETVTLNESGSSPKRGQRSFNTALEPAEVTMSTYMRPEFDAGGVGGAGTEDDDDDDKVICEESVLWQALAQGSGTQATSSWTETGGPTPVSTLKFETSSNSHQLMKFGLIIKVDNVTYLVNNCVVDQAVVDFGIDAIATIAWTIRGSVIKQASADLTVDAPTNGVSPISGAVSGNCRVKDSDAAFLANKLSTFTLKAGIKGSTSGAVDLDIPVTSGSITFSNNISYLTPANLGIVNEPVTYFAGTRSISGSLTGYLRTGSVAAQNATGAILKNLLDNSSTEIEPAYKVSIAVGGSTANTNRVVIEIPAAVLTIPTISVEQVVSTTINFTAQGTVSSENKFDIEQANEATVNYYAVA